MRTTAASKKFDLTKHGEGKAKAADRANPLWNRTHLSHTKQLARFRAANGQGCEFRCGRFNPFLQPYLITSCIVFLARAAFTLLSSRVCNRLICTCITHAFTLHSNL